jgi:predicted metallopeptidase
VTRVQIPAAAPEAIPSRCNPLKNSPHPLTPALARRGILRRIHYEVAEDVCRVVDVLTRINDFKHVRRDRIYCVRSFGAKTTAIARIHGCPPIWRIAGVEASYIIEVIAERFYRLAPLMRVEVIIHELLHIPKTFSGALRPHGRMVNDEVVGRIMRTLKKKGLLSEACKVWESSGLGVR